MARRIRQGRPVWVPGDLYNAILDRAGEKKAAKFVRDAVIQALGRERIHSESTETAAHTAPDFPRELEGLVEQVDTLIDRQRQQIAATDDMGKSLMAVQRVSVEAAANRTAHAAVSIQSLAILENVLTLLIDQHGLGESFEARERTIQNRFNELRREYFLKDRTVTADQQQRSRA